MFKKKPEKWVLIYMLTLPLFCVSCPHNSSLMLPSWTTTRPSSSAPTTAAKASWRSTGTRWRTRSNRSTCPETEDSARALCSRANEENPLSLSPEDKPKEWKFGILQVTLILNQVYSSYHVYAFISSRPDLAISKFGLALLVTFTYFEYSGISLTVNHIYQGLQWKKVPVMVKNKA